MNMEQLRYFLSVARHRNFTEAAKEFYLTQPAITHQISALEQDLGIKLLHRTTRSVSLTRAGELFLEDAKRMLDLEERARERMRQTEHSSTPVLEIGYLNSPTRHFLPQLVRRFQEQYPQARVKLCRRDADGLRKDCEQGAYDVAVSVLQDLQDITGYHCRKLGSDFYCLVCPKDHPCAEASRVHYDLLATEPFVCLSKNNGSYMYKQFRQICRRHGFTPRILAEYPAMEDVLFAVECGQALAILPYHIRDYMHTNLAFLPLEAGNLSIDTGLAWRKDAESPAVQWFVERVNHVLVEQPELF